MDFAKVEASKRGYDTIMVVVDWRTKFERFIAMKQTASAVDIVELYTDWVV